MNQIKTTRLNLIFQYLGKRDYVHGSSMLDGMLKCTQAFLPAGIDQPAKIKMFKVIKEFGSQAWAESMWTEDAKKHPLLKNAAARLDLRIGERSVTSFVFPKPDEAVTDRIVSYDAADYVEKISVEENGGCSGKLVKICNLVDLIRGIVEVNRQAHWKETEDVDNISKMRWAYLANFHLFSDAEASTIQNIRLAPKAVFDDKGHRLTVKQVHLDGYDARYDSDMCFFVQINKKVESGTPLA